jgi:hypothetical protein
MQFNTCHESCENFVAHMKRQNRRRERHAPVAAPEGVFLGACSVAVRQAVSSSNFELISSSFEYQDAVKLISEMQRFFPRY